MYSSSNNWHHQATALVLIQDIYKEWNDYRFFSSRHALKSGINFCPTIQLNFKIAMLTSLSLGPSRSTQSLVISLTSALDLNVLLSRKYWEIISCNIPPSHAVICCGICISFNFIRTWKYLIDNSALTLIPQITTDHDHLLSIVCTCLNPLPCTSNSGVVKLVPKNSQKNNFCWQKEITRVSWGWQWPQSLTARHSVVDHFFQFP